MYLAEPPPRASLDRSERAARVAVIVASAVGAALADTSPTGHNGADLFWRVLAAVAVTCAGCTCGPVARMVPAVVAAAVSASLEAWGVAAASCVVLVASALLPHRGRWAGVAGAAVVGATVSILFRLPDFEQARITTLLAVAGAVVVLVSGWQGASRHTRRTVAWVGGIGLGVVACMSVPFVLMGALARSDVNRGAGEANAWRVLTAEGDDDAAALHLDGAESAFAEAADSLEGWWMEPARFLPVVAQHAAAADIGVASGLRLVESAQDILDVADPEELKLSDGTLDLRAGGGGPRPGERGSRHARRVENDLDGLEQDWLMPSIQSDVREVTSQVRDAEADAAFADRALAVVPGAARRRRTEALLRDLQHAGRGARARGDPRQLGHPQRAGRAPRPREDRPVR